jgi:hypothetical protein
MREVVEGLAEIGAGLSIRLPGERGERKINGKRTITAEKLLRGPFNSVDIVTLAGRGGQFVLAESAQPWPGDAAVTEWLQESGAKADDEEAFLAWSFARESKQQQKEREAMDLKEALAMIETLTGERDAAKAEVARLREAEALRGARSLVEKLVGADTVKLPDVTKARLVETITPKAPIVDGVLDTEKLTATVTEAIAKEAEYVAQIRGGSKVKGMGGGSSPDGRKRLVESFAAMYREQGLPADKALEKAEAVAGRG